MIKINLNVEVACDICNTIKSYQFNELTPIREYLRHIGWKITKSKQYCKECKRKKLKTTDLNTENFNMYKQFINDVATIDINEVHFNQLHTIEDKIKTQIFAATYTNGIDIDNTKIQFNEINIEYKRLETDEEYYQRVQNNLKVRKSNE